MFVSLSIRIIFGAVCSFAFDICHDERKGEGDADRENCFIFLAVDSKAVLRNLLLIIEINKTICLMNLQFQKF